MQAELYRVKKAFDKAEPLYLDAISILEESYGHDDIRYIVHYACQSIFLKKIHILFYLKKKIFCRVGAALHNLGQFYLIKNELDKAHACYEVYNNFIIKS